MAVSKLFYRTFPIYEDASLRPSCSDLGESSTERVKAMNRNMLITVDIYVLRRCENDEAKENREPVRVCDDGIISRVAREEHGGWEFGSRRPSKRRKDARSER